MDSMGIGALARRVAVRVDTVRYCERTGLLAPSPRGASAYRRYGALELARLRFLRSAGGLPTLIAVCPGHGRAEDCPILKPLEDPDP